MSGLISAGVILAIIFFIIMAIPCVGISILGYKMLSRVGQHPSKMPAVQMSVFIKLVILEFFSFFLLALFYHILVDYS